MGLSAAVIISRQALHPCLDNTWVTQTIKAVKWIKENKIALGTSFGMQTWELVTALGSINQIEMKIFIPSNDKKKADSIREYLIKQFNLNTDKIEFICLPNSCRNAGKAALMHQRDKCIINDADILMPISIRKNGKFETLLEKNISGTKIIITQFKTDYETRKETLSYKILPEDLNPDLIDISQNYLIHWTRTANTAWPTERLLDYYQAVIQSDRYPRSAYDSLLNIITNKFIKASPKNIPNKIPVVSFSDQTISEMVNLMRWRTRYKQMSFEPYGIGIEKKTALDMAIHPVKYYNKKEYKLSNKDNNYRWLSQSLGDKSDWRVEQEYRHKGDLKLTDITLDRLILICHTEKEARRISNHTGIRAVSFITVL